MKEYGSFSTRPPNDRARRMTTEKTAFAGCGSEGRGAESIMQEEGMMSDFSIREMLAMQQALQEKYSDRWEPVCSEAGKHKLLWMIGEIGEVTDIIKKNGETKALEDSELRRHLVEEMADVLMYYNDVLLCYGISDEELKAAYTAKFERNMKRW